MTCVTGVHHSAKQLDEEDTPHILHPEFGIQMNIWLHAHHGDFSQIYAVATFYNAFSLKLRVAHLIRVCMGAACHVRGAPQILARLESKLAIHAGETTRIRALPSESSMIELLVWTEVKREALVQKVRALQEAFGAERLNWICPKALEWCHALNIIVVDDRDVQLRHGYAALLDSLWVRPTRVWGKTEILPRPVEHTALT
jgi:hypothetical protein